MNLRNLILISFIFLLASCSSDDGDANNPDTSSLSFKINGEERVALPGVSTAAIVEVNILGLTTSSITITGASEIVQGDRWAISFGFTSTQALNLASNPEWNTNTIPEMDSFGGFYTVDEDGQEVLDAETTDEDTVFNFKITSFNETNQTVSGEFSFEIIENITGDVYQITEGVFNNLTYTNISE
jgi:hypothetical protein